jgi:tRNA-dependent cyclodipeptide synthase
MAINVTGAIKQAAVADVVSLLDSQKIRYKISRFSPHCAKEELDREASRLGLGLLEAIPLDVPGRGIVLTVIPSSLAVRLDELAKLLGVQAVRVPEPAEMCERFMSVDLASAIPPVYGLAGFETFLSPLIGRQRTVAFALGSTTLVTMETREFRRTLGNASDVPVPTRLRYRAYARPDRKTNEHCILGISLESPDFYTPKLVTITEWIRNQYRQCTAMLGDGLYRISLQVESDTPEDDALEYSKWIARDFVHSQWPVFTLRESGCHFDLKFCSDVLTGDSCYPAYYAQVNALFASDSAFQESCRAFARDFLRRKPQRQENTDKNIDLSCRYLLEELAIISCLAQDGPCSFVYPGSLTILEEIAQGQHPGVPAPLLSIDYVELKLKHRDAREE